MAPAIIVGNSQNWYPDLIMPPFALDITVLRALFDAVNRLRVAGGRTKSERAATQAALPKFDDFATATVGTFTNANLHPGRLLYVGMSIEGKEYVSDWHCRVSEDWILLTGISRWRVYDGLPLINAAQIKWQETVRWMNAVRPYAWHWFEEHQKSTCADGARGRKRDFAAFENDFKE